LQAHAQEDVADAEGVDGEVEDPHRAPEGEGEEEGDAHGAEEGEEDVAPTPAGLGPAHGGGGGAARLAGDHGPAVPGVAAVVAARLGPGQAASPSPGGGALQDRELGPEAGDRVTG